jgi:hypothetical protein
LHSPEWDNEDPDAEQHKADHKRKSTFRRSSGQVRQHYATLISRLAQTSLPKLFFLLIIAPAIAVMAK